MSRFKTCLILFLGIYLLTATSCKDQQKLNTPSSPAIKEIKENYGTGQKSRVYQMIDGKIEGKMTDYYPSGAVKGEKYFEDGHQHGKTTMYYESGKVKEVQYYKAGLRNAGDTIFYEDGTLKYVSGYKDNIKNGYQRKWGEDGVLIYEAKYAMDTLVEVNGKAVVQEKIAK